jgi:hypothetical protein
MVSYVRVTVIRESLHGSQILDCKEICLSTLFIGLGHHFLLLQVNQSKFTLFSETF